MNKIRIVFFGTPQISAVGLQHFMDDTTIDVVAVVTNPDALLGRKQILTPSPVKTLAIQHTIPVFTPQKASDPDFIKSLEDLHADFFVVISYGKILPQNLIDIPKKGTYNLHFSLLPAYRGASPVQSAILQGEKISGITLFKIVPELDAGDIVFQESWNIADKTTQQCLTELQEEGAKHFVSFVKNYDMYPHIPQNHTLATFCKKIEKISGEVFPKTESAISIWRKYLAYTPWPGIYSFLADGTRVKWIEVARSSLQSISSVAGEMKIQDGRIFLQTSDGVLEIITIQKEGKTPTPAYVLSL